MDPRLTSAARFQDFLARLWNENCTNGRKLLIEVRKQGYTGSFSHLERLFQKWRSAGAAAASEEPYSDETAIAMVIPKVSPVAASSLA